MIVGMATTSIIVAAFFVVAESAGESLLSPRRRRSAAGIFVAFVVGVVASMAARRLVALGSCFGGRIFGLAGPPRIEAGSRQPLFFLLFRLALRLILLLIIRGPEGLVLVDLVGLRRRRVLVKEIVAPAPFLSLTSDLGGRCLDTICKKNIL